MVCYLIWLTSFSLALLASVESTKPAALAFTNKRHKIQCIEDYIEYVFFLTISSLNKPEGNANMHFGFWSWTNNDMFKYLFSNVLIKEETVILEIHKIYCMTCGVKEQ